MNAEIRNDITITSDRVEEDIGESDDPVVAAIIDHWKKLKGEQLAPYWSDWDWLAIPTKAIKHCGVVDVIKLHGSIDLVYRFWGSAHAAAHKQVLTGKSVKDMIPASHAEQVFSQYMICFERRAPCLFVTTTTHSELGMTIDESSLRIPFVDTETESIGHVMAYSYISTEAETARQVLISSIS